MGRHRRGATSGKAALECTTFSVSAGVLLKPRFVARR